MMKHIMHSGIFDDYVSQEFHECFLCTHDKDAYDPSLAIHLQEVGMSLL